MIHRCQSRSACRRTVWPVRTTLGLAAVLVIALASASARTTLAADEDRNRGADESLASPPAHASAAAVHVNRPAELEPAVPGSSLDRRDAARTLQTVALFALISLAPVGLLMVTAFVRINIVLTLLRQALGSPQVPGNPVLTALALLLTALVMWPRGEVVYHDAILPYASGQLSAGAAWTAGSQPIKAFMVEQIVLTSHEDYLEALHEYAVPPSPGKAPAVPARPEDFPLRVVVPAYLLSELTTALLIGFFLYLPFLVIDLVVSSVLAATGLFMLPPALVATPVKLILFVLAKGWLLVATMLLSTFGTTGAVP
jgi:flagellar biosynthetic protein FliP